MATLPPYPGTAWLTAGPSPPQDGMRGRGRKAQRRRIFWCHIRQGIQDSADTTRFFGGGVSSLAVRAHGAGTTVSNAGSIEHTHRPIVFATSLLWIERGPLPTTQRAIRLREKVVSPQASSSRSTCPLWRRDQLTLPEKDLSRAEFQVEGGGK